MLSDIRHRSVTYSQKFITKAKLLHLKLSSFTYSIHINYFSINYSTILIYFLLGRTNLLKSSLSLMLKQGLIKPSTLPSNSNSNSINGASDNLTTVLNAIKKACCDGTCIYLHPCSIILITYFFGSHTQLFLKTILNYFCFL